LHAHLLRSIKSVHVYQWEKPVLGEVVDPYLNLGYQTALGRESFHSLHGFMSQAFRSITA
jgi:hypothetical protein